MRSFTLRIVVSASAASRLTTMPPTTSPVPSISAMPTPLGRAQLHPGDVPQQHRRAVPVSLQHDALEVADVAQVSAPPDHVLGLGHLDRAPADVLVARPHGLAHARERDAEGLELPRVLESDTEDPEVLTRAGFAISGLSYDFPAAFAALRAFPG